jgi:hypothetical protein
MGEGLISCPPARLLLERLDAYTAGCVSSSVIFLGKVGAMTPRLTCLVRRHRWHAVWDNDQHKTVSTCNRCGKTKVRISDAEGRSALGWGGGP